MYGLLYGFVEHYFFQQQRQQELLKTEVAFLRSQINPHFLFNTINDVYALALTRPALAPNALLKLSDLLRYTLYSSNTELVPLSKEVDYLLSYIELESISQEGKGYFKTTFPTDTTSYHIAPMMLIPFVENAIKHGVTKSQEHPIEIELTAEASKLSFRCYNQIRSGNKDSKRGIGLLNARRRLELEYPNRHKLSIQITENIFEVDLLLNI